jgi:hypothetical protein
MADIVGATLERLHDVLRVLRTRAEVRKEIEKLLKKEFRVEHFKPEDIWAPLRYVKNLGELQPEKQELLELLGFELGDEVELLIENAYIRLALKDCGEEKDVEIGTPLYGLTPRLFLKLALLFDEHDWEEMRRSAEEKLRFETRLLEELKVIESLLSEKLRREFEGNH